MENLLTSSRNRNLLFAFLIGLILLGAGFFIFKNDDNFTNTHIEVLGEAKSGETLKELKVEISGEVKNPGVYNLPLDARIDDLILAAGGLTSNFDKTWTDKYLNRAAKLMDGQKVFIPKVSEQSDSTSAKNSGGYQTISTTFSSDSNTIININTASLEQIDTLPGIGQKYGQSIIEHRPYSDKQELVSKGAISQSLFEKIKDRISIY